MARVPDRRLDALSQLFAPRKTTAASVHYIDVPGIPEEHRQEAAFNIPELRATDVLLVVVRAFADGAVKIVMKGLHVGMPLPQEFLFLLGRPFQPVRQKADRVAVPTGDIEVRAHVPMVELGDPARIVRELDRDRHLGRGQHFGNVFVGVQPAFGYEGDPMRLLFEQGFAPTHAFSAFYRYLRDDYAAHAVLHFGTHGALEFMPGKQSGMSGNCWPDRLIGDLPNYYLYASNNPSEGMIAKRRAASSAANPSRSRRRAARPPWYEACNPAARTPPWSS